VKPAKFLQIQVKVVEQRMGRYVLPLAYPDEILFGPQRRRA
jgi:hypothetical protein